MIIFSILFVVGTLIFSTQQLNNQEDKPNINIFQDFNLCSIIMFLGYGFFCKWHYYLDIIKIAKILNDNYFVYIISSTTKKLREIK